MLFNGIGIGVFGLVLIIGAGMDILGEESFLRLTRRIWPSLQFGSVGSLLSYFITLLGLCFFIARAWSGK